MTTIGELFDIQQGKQVSKSNRIGENQRPFLRTANVFWGGFDLSRLDHMHFSASEEEKYRLQPGDLLVCEGGDVGRSAVWEGVLEDCYYQNHLHRLRPKSKETNSYYGLFWLQYAFTQSNMYNGRANNTTIPNLSKSRLAELDIKSTDGPTQEKIANTLLSLKRNIETQQLTLTKLDELKKSMMHHLFSYGTQNEKTKEYKLGKIAKIQSGGTPSRKRSEYWNGDIHWVKTGEIKYRDILVTSEHITAEGLNNSSAKIFPKGTLLMAMYGQGITRGRVAMLGIDAAINQACAAIVPKEEIVTSRYLYYYLEHSYDSLREIGHGANQKNMSATLLKNLDLKIPDLPFQKDAVITLSAIDKKIAVTSGKLNTLEKLFDTLLNQLMTGKIEVA